MPEIAFISFIWNLCSFVIAILVGWLVLRQLDRWAGIKFSDVMEHLHENPLALALYFGLRFVGMCILGSAFIS